ncbi:MAG: 2',3'-cyclic-nucleotide 2'-phosphodiesterase (5'-nucleotidase family), partial [Paracoccaceae bacterium]
MLNIGDIALIGLKADNPDDFAFAALVDIPEGETIRFTDNGIVAGGALATSEAIVEWTSPAGGIAAGSVIGFDGNLDFALLAGSLGLSTSGDQIIAFQGEPTAPSFLFSLQSNSTAFQDGASDSNSSGLPAGLTFGVSALAMGAGPGAGDEYDNIHYAGPLTGTRAAILSAIADPANWVGADAPEGYAAPAAFTVEPTLPFNLQITEIWSGNNPGGNLTADWFELTNTGGTAWTAATDSDIFFDDDSFSAIVADRLNGIDSIAPGETVIYVGDVDTAQFIAVWGEVIDLGGVQIGTHDGSGLGGGGDAVTLFREAGTQGDATLDAPVLLDFERYPDASAFGGRSWDVNASAFSSVATGAFATAPNDEGQAAIGTPGNGGAPAVPEAAYTLELLHISDQEAATGAISDAPGMSAVLNSLRAQDLGGDGLADNTLTLSSGDSFIPGVFFKASETAFGSGGIADIQIQNELGIQAIGLGNHEFDFGTSALGKLISGAAAGTILGADFAGAAYPYLSTNLSFASDINLAPLAVVGGAAPLANSVTSSVVINVGGENIGIVGATTPTLGTISVPGALTISPDSFDGTPTDAQLDALSAVIQAEVDALLTSDPTLNKVILLAHMQRLDIEASLAARLVGVDIIVGGGSNTRLFDANDTPRSGDSVQGVYPQFIENAGGTITALVNTDGSYKYVGRLVLDFDAEGNVIPSSYDVDVSGAYATDAAGVAAL